LFLFEIVPGIAKQSANFLIHQGLTFRAQPHDIQQPDILIDSDYWSLNSSQLTLVHRGCCTGVVCEAGDAHDVPRTHLHDRSLVRAAYERVEPTTLDSHRIGLGIRGRTLNSTRRSDFFAKR